ncbi:Desmoglein-2 [Bagarius yarrelli]|uniref:Desmoglein-2 n=1 Tax=Bagarius yarrelli TaxID=175774 RepID=A0A556TSV7_BAGYA|nr:Desmoglein-2 [Bagarius yarrelli]
MTRLWRSTPILWLFVFVVLCGFEAKADHSVSLRRNKREWIVPPQILEENVDYTKQLFIAKIRSDKEDPNKGPIKYALKGIGADQPPYNLFIVEPSTGKVRITGILDRESIAQYNLSGVALYPDGSVAENDIQLRIKVKDQNDCPPVFLPISVGSVKELSTVVMKLNVTDNDEFGNVNSQIRYEIVEQKPGGNMMFSINQYGEVIVNSANLDREAVDQYVLTVKASDLNGASGANTAMATFNIQIEDVNDNPPILEQESFEASIEENTDNLEVMRFKTTDLDLINTENWQAQYSIVSGNGGGHFKIVTDPKTNEGVLMLVKGADYEEVKDMNLGITVSNVAAAYAGSWSSGTVVVGGGGGGGGGEEEEEEGGGGGGGGGEEEEEEGRRIMGNGRQRGFW